MHDPVSQEPIRRRILEAWLQHHGFDRAVDVACLLMSDASEGDVAARLFIVQASHWFAARDGGLDLQWEIA